MISGDSRKFRETWQVWNISVWIHYTTATNTHLQYVSHEQSNRRVQDCPKSGRTRKVKGKDLFYDLL